MKAYERLMHYATYATVSDESNPHCPSTPNQLVLGKDLVKEMLEMGMKDAHMDEHGYVMGTIPSTIPDFKGYVIGFVAHMDVAHDAPSEHVKPHIVKNYDGGDILLNKEKNIILSPSVFPLLKDYIGDDLVVTDGTTLLGADDKAGVAEILTMAEILLGDESILHGPIKIGFTPDEEIGRGANLFDVEKFGADFAYTVDGSFFGEVIYETFNAFSATVTINGVSIHPGEAKDQMINASSVATEFDQLLPAAERPQHTENYEGFYHLTSMKGNVEVAELSYIIRDHDGAVLQGRLKMMDDVTGLINKKYGEGTATTVFTESYHNMAEPIKEHWHLIETAEQAIRNVGGTPFSPPVRGGTDGSRLSFMGLPCPNLGTGSHNHHGRMEYASVQAMDKVVQSIVEIAKIYGGKGRE